MPVIVEQPTVASTEDFTDLQKIYQDAPDWLLWPYANANILIHQALADGSLLAGRFNGRLLGAALLTKDETHWRLSHLCVRLITRNRGVGRRLLDEARRLAAEAGQPLHLAAPPNNLESQALAARSGMPLDAL